MRRSTKKPIGIVAILVSTVLLAGCQSAMSASTMNSSPASANPTNRTPVEWPLRFKSHSFGVRCYDTYGCKVAYANRWQVRDDENTLERSSASYGPDYLKDWTGGHLGIRNFPEPAKVIWRSKDGVAHEAEIDIGAIFKDQLIRHNVPREEVADLTGGKYDSNPSILLEVNDRTIRVYMSAFISTKSLQRPEGKHSNYRDDVILVETYTY